MARRLGIITPYHEGVRRYLGDVCLSVDRQTVPALHVLVGDGVHERVAAGPGERINVPLERRTRDSGGTPRAVGAAIARSRGCEVIAYLDADDTLDPRFADLVLKTFDASGADVISTPQALRGPDMERLASADLPAGSERVHWISEVLSAWRGPTFGRAFLSPAGLALGPGAKSFDSLWTRIPLPLSRLHDIWFSWALLSAPLTTAWLPRALYRYRITDGDWFRRSGLAVPNGLEPLEGEKVADVRLAKTTFRRLEESPDAFQRLCSELSVDLARIPMAADINRRLRAAHPDFAVLRDPDGAIRRISAEKIARQISGRDPGPVENVWQTGAQVAE